MKMFYNRLLLLGMIAFGSAHANTLLVYDPVDFYHNANNTVSVTTVAAGVIATDLVPNGGIFTGNNFKVWPFEAIIGPLDPSRYASFVIQPDFPNQELSFDSISYSARSYFDSNLTLHLRSSLDNFTTDIDSFSDGGGDPFRIWQAVFDLSGLTPVAAPVEFRFYPANSGPESDFMDLASTEEDDIGGATGLIVSGTILIVATEPIPLLNGFGLLLLIASFIATALWFSRRQVTTRNS